MIPENRFSSHHKTIPGLLAPHLKRFFAFLVLTFCGQSLFASEDWLQWGGPDGDFTVSVDGLAEKWPETGPKQLWERPLGDGYSAILHQAGRLYTMYRENDGEVVVCLDARTGKTLWEHRYARVFWPDMDEFRQGFTRGPNATPIVVDDRLIAIGIAGRMVCLDTHSGRLIWEQNLPETYGRRKRREEYGYSSSPLRYKQTVIVLVGGTDHAVIAIEPKSGDIVWKSQPGGISYAPARLIRLAGRDQFIYFEQEGVVALDPDTGRLLWRSPVDVDNGNHLTPVVKCDENHLWVSSQFSSGGGRLLEVVEKGSTLSAERVWFKSRLRGSCWTLIRRGDYIYGSAGGHNVSLLSAFNWRTGEIVWQHRGYHMAQCLYADDKLIFLDESGQLGLARVSPQKLEVLATASVTESVSWTLPTLIGTKLYLRDRKNVLALDLGHEANP